MTIENFDPAKVTITRHRFSTTQGETSIEYGITDLGRYGDDPMLLSNGEYHQKSDAYWIGYAKSKAQSDGLTFWSYDPGQVMPNGRFAIACRNGIVLALLPGSATPYATWAIDHLGGTYQGDYHREFAAAVAAFNKRAGQ